MQAGRQAGMTDSGSYSVEAKYLIRKIGSSLKYRKIKLLSGKEEMKIREKLNVEQIVLIILMIKVFFFFSSTYIRTSMYLSTYLMG